CHPWHVAVLVIPLAGLAFPACALYGHPLPGIRRKNGLRIAAVMRSAVKTNSGAMTFVHVVCLRIATSSASPARVAPVCISAWKALPPLNAGIVLAGIWTMLPVLALRPARAWVTKPEALKVTQPTLSRMWHVHNFVL